VRRVVALLIALCVLLSGLLQPTWAGARETQYDETLTESSHTGDTSYYDHQSLTFTPAASTSYLFVYSCQHNYSSSTGLASLRLYDDTNAVTMAEDINQTTSTSEYKNSFGMAKWDAGASPVSTTFKVQGKASNSGHTIKIKNGSLLALALGANDQWAASDSESTTTSGTPQTKTTLSWTPGSAGYYLIIAYAEVSNSHSTGQQTIVKLSDGTTAYAEASETKKSTSDYIRWGTATVQNLSGSQTWTIQYSSGSGTTAKIRNARIVALRLSDFDNYYSAEDRTRSTHTGDTSYQDKLTLTTTPLNLEHVGIGVGMLDMSATTVQGQGQAIEGATTANQEHVVRMTNTNKESTFLTLYRKTLAASSTTWKIQYATSNQFQDVGISDTMLVLLQTEASPAGGGSTLHLLNLLGVGK
jgi:hypothetical protein